MEKNFVIFLSIILDSTVGVDFILIVFLENDRG